MFVVFAEPARTPQPCEGAFDDPAAGQHLEAVERRGAFNDLQPSATAGTQAADPIDQRTGVTAVRPDTPQPAEAGAAISGVRLCTRRRGLPSKTQPQGEGKRRGTQSLT